MTALVHRPLGQRIPDRLHAVSCSLPTMRDVIGYEEKDPAITAHLTSGYPRFVVHPLLRRAAVLLQRQQAGLAGREIWLCAGPVVAAALHAHLDGVGKVVPVTPYLTAYAFPPAVSLADDVAAALSRRTKHFLQHTGGFASSRAAEDWLAARGEIEAAVPVPNEAAAKAASEQVRGAMAGFFGAGLTADAVCLTPSGMAATYAAFQAVNAVQAPHGRTRWVQLGWLYLDTIAILQKFTATPAEDYLHHVDVFDLTGLEKLFVAHAGKIAGVLAEVPTNPLIQTPALPALAALCRAHGVALVVDPTIASTLNVDVLPHADVVVNSLTKYTAGEGDVIMGAAAVNPASPLAGALRPALAAAAFSPVYPRDLVRLADQIGAAPGLVASGNAGAVRVVGFLRGHPKVAEVFWSGHEASAANYAALARTPGSVGSMITFTLRPNLALPAFYDRLRIAKGPSFGLSTSLICPFMYLAHYELVTTEEGRAELRRNGLNPDLLRLSVGAEPAEEIIAALAEALD
ncbi:MAG: PLP-dependent transferase [Verrucomicrobia bacterium]|nr:PLP-dependent transferase [Verrucomicrobiota bacterium]